VSRIPRQTSEPAAVESRSLEARMDALVGVVSDLLLEIRASRAQDAKRRTPSSRDARDELLLLLLAQLFADDSVQVFDVLARAVQSPELLHALRCAGAENGWQLGNWFARVENREIDGAHVIRMGRNGRGVIWRVLT
jgi:hypothetical protein